MAKPKKRKSVSSSVSQRGKPKRQKNARKKRTRKVRSKKLFYSIIVFLLCLLFSYLGYLNFLIQKRFDGETWARPSRVYARPLELYTGLKVTSNQLVEELKLADYQQVTKIRKPGQFALSKNRIELFSREFFFSDNYQQEAKISIDLSQSELRSLRNMPTNKELDYYQLTPALIGSYTPGNGEDRMVIGKNEIPEMLINILLAVEDRQFYSHFGVNPLAIARALIANIKAGKTVQGGSTLTQQLAKNLFLSPKRSLVRKINEAVMSIMLEIKFSKNALLTAYINEVFLLQQKGIAVHGFALASKLLFKQPLKHLSADQFALLVGMVKGPSLFNPISNPKNAVNRRNTVLDIMFTTGMIKQSELNKLKLRPLNTVRRLPPVNPFPAYLDLVKKQLRSNYDSDDLSQKRLHIFTAFDPIKQRQLELGLKNGLHRFKDKNLQSAVIMADYLNGDLLALVGDRNTDFPGFNRAISAQRPIGSLIKPMLLYGLLNNGNTLATKVEDKPIQVKLSDNKMWNPKNYDKKYHGEMTLYDAMVHSYNLPFVHLGLSGNHLKLLAQNLNKIHLLKKEIVYPSILLGTTAMTPYEVAQMYQVMANNGYFAPLTTIRQVMDQSHSVLTRVPVYSAELYNRATMTQVQRALIGVTEEGTARYLKKRFTKKTYAGKTGTTNDLRDSWFAGFSNRYLTVVWLGNDDNKPVKLTGSSGALRVWADITDQQNLQSLKLNLNPDLEWLYIDRIEGGKTSKNCENSVILPFLKGTGPDFNSACNESYFERALNWFQN